jgi:hypothetical protein
MDRRLLLSAGLGAAAALGLGSGPALAQRPPAFEPPRHEQDDWLEQIPGKHRVIIDAASPTGAGEAILFTRNLLSGNRNTYGLADGDCAIVMVFRHLATRLAFNDAIWAKYGKVFSEYLKFTDPKTDKAPVVNLYNASGYGDDLSTQGVTIGEMVKRGAQLAICDGSTRRISQLTARATGGSGDEIYNELKANPVVPNSRFVPLGVLAVTRAQERGYSLLSVG